MPAVKDENGGSTKKPQPAPPKKPTAPIVKPAPPATPAPKQPVKPAPANTPAQSRQVGTTKVNSQAISTATTKPPLPKAAPVKPTKPQFASGKPTLAPVSLRYEQELLNNPMLKKIDRKMKEHPDLFGAVLRASDSPEKAFDKMFAMWGRDEEMDAKALKVFKTNGNFRQQDNVDEDELTNIVAEVLIDWNKMVANHSVEPNQHSVAAFRVLSDLVASYTGDNLDDYLYVMNTLLLRYSTSGDAGMIATVGVADLTGSDLPNVLPPYISSFQIGTEDLSHDYFDEGDQNQIGHHLWAYIATGASPGNNAWLNDDLTGTLWRNDLIGTLGNFVHDGVQEMVIDNLLRQGVSASWADALGGEVGLTLGMRLRAGEITPSEFGRYFEEVFSQPYTRFVPEVEVRNLLVTVSTIGFTVFGGPVEPFDNDGRPTYVVDILEWLLPLRDR